ncbi:Peptidoglycan-binding (PGRP) domain of peptidoglycan hydrolases-containing protein [Asanoa hainanensis]|uniref:Peptidoglycan-binding (PGRP) domain of peptidoglycan hydrolases-containing protein n=1 Tax=Asanoa hainanensis TaxID=560556 RepID=A0A239N5M4_9ACTN|nr:neuraminidase-like domain-containing protein [Asanoa hainanensis]SNT49754.1 Peptidoglycan-binding (PGRP) domain of peptidoglycan hydrolases-containing protein [Asanoa hainanensis]
MSIDAIRRLTGPVEGRAGVMRLQRALRKLRGDIDEAEARRGELGATTAGALRAIQERAGLPVTGEPTEATLARIRAELEHAYVVDSRTRTARLHALLGQLGVDLPAAERARREAGPATRAALTERYGLPPDGLLDAGLVDRLRADALAARLSSKRQVALLQQTLVRALRIRGIDADLDPAERRARQLGPTSRDAIRAFQARSGLPATGEVDPDTMDRLRSVAASRAKPARQLTVRSPRTLAPVRQQVRLNMTGPRVGAVQRALAFLGQPVARAEFTGRTFGRSTRAAVEAYQRGKGLLPTGHVDRLTLRALNADIAHVNPLGAVEHPYRLRGTVRDELWQGMAGVTVRVRERLVRGDGDVLAERPTTSTGFFDLAYDPPREPATKQVRDPFGLTVTFLSGDGTELGRRLLFNPPLIAWANLTLGPDPYRGVAELDARAGALAKVLAGVPIADLRETTREHEITRAALGSGLAQDDVMRIVLSHRVAAVLDHPALGPAACYAFVRQNLPASLPEDLLAGTHEWRAIDEVVGAAAAGLAFLDPALAAQAFDNAAAENLVAITVVRQRDEILAALAERRRSYALDQPILTGDGTLRGLLDASTVPADDHTAVADAFVTHGGFDSAFWADVRSRPADFGGPAAVADLEATVTLGQVTANHPPTLALLKETIAAPGGELRRSHDVAKLSVDEWATLVADGGGGVPAGTPGSDPEQQLRAYATALATRAEQVFPTVALAAALGRDDAHGLTHVADASRFIDRFPELDLRADNVDAFVANHAPDTDALVTSDLRVMQRAHRLTPDAATARALLDHRLHSSAQIVGMGRQRLLETLDAEGVDRRTALTIHANAEFQYAQVLQRLGEYRFELQLGNPAALMPRTFTPEEAEAVLGDIPNLEMLFGSLDYCDCSHCQSVYGPAAYLADVLRFLEQHPAKLAGRTVRDVLFDRRGDLGNIKLNCANTDTPLPYVDLVNEILECAVPAPATQPDFAYQTTRDAAELRAFPEHQRAAAYDVLAAADYPLTGVLDLAQEEARAFLGHLGTPRHELMRALRRAGSPTAVSVAGEYFGIATHETNLIVSSAPTATAQNRFWGFDTTRATVPVSEFLDHARIGYAELLALLQVKWLAGIALERPGGTCDVGAQTLSGLSLAAFDKLHRFLRLWRRTGWQMWELDLLLRAPRVAAGALNASALVALYHFRRVTERLALTFESALVLYADVNTETRAAPDDATVVYPSLYETRFQNPAVVNPVDPAFALPLPGTEPLSAHHPALCAGFGVTEADLLLLLARTGALLTVPNLSVPLRLVGLAAGLGVPIADALTLVDLVAGDVPDPFASPAATAALIERYDDLVAAGATVPELDYLLNHRPDAAAGPRDDVITQQVEGLRESLRSTPDDQRDGQIAAQVASTFGILDAVASTLVARLAVDGTAVLTHLADPALTARDADDAYVDAVTEATFPDIFASWRLLHKTTLLVTRLRAGDDPTVLTWLVDHATAYAGLDVNDLPVAAPPAAPLFGAWRNLAAWVSLRARHPEPEGVTLTGIFDLARTNTSTVDEVRTAVSALTRWSVTDLAALDGANRAGYRDMDVWRRLSTAFGHLQRLGVAAATAVAWADRDTTAAGARTRAAQEIRQAARARYTDDAWLTTVTPLQDALRERKRDALAAYLVEHSMRTVPATITVDGAEWANPRHWRDAADLMRWFLIDTEMAACQLTSRIKQAIGAVQMFVQRCLLNLESAFVVVSTEQRADEVSLDAWSQWKWMKSYRLWEANRKVFLYPENWILPELRDDKSPFFVELENEILQNEITTANCEAAFLHYLQKVHEVSRLTVVGSYHEIADVDPTGALPPATNILHVIARGRVEPAQYFYRTFDLSYATWTPWEQIDLDITGDHVVPVVYNRRLHLFWLTFTEKPQKVAKQPPAKASSAPTDSPEPPRQLEIQLAWSVRRDGGWTSRRLAPHKLIHPWQRPRSSYLLKPRYREAENQLWLDVYLSTSPEFNNTKFYDPYTDTRAFVTAFRFNETALPWHSSSFVFDGDVVGLRLKPLHGQYHVLGAEGIASTRLVPTTSYRYVHDSFGEDGRAIGALTRAADIAGRLTLPNGMHFANTRLVNNTASPNLDQFGVLESGRTVNLLGRAKAPFELVVSPHRPQFDTAADRGPVFYQDSARAHFVRPEWTAVLQGAGQLTYRWYPFYHPYTALFIRELNRGGLDGLLNRLIQTAPAGYPPVNTFAFAGTYGPSSRSAVDESAAADTVDFSPYGAYALYNWEIFFHAPMLVATKLSQNQRFQEAMDWFHRIFDPTNTTAVDAPQRYWITKPFFDQNAEDYRTQRIEELLGDIGANLDQLRAWKNNPFQPHLIARTRPVAYQKSVLMAYLDNLIAWADQLFRGDTMELINEATLLYVLAQELLGKRPVKVPAPERADRSYRELVADGALDPFGNKRVEVLMENVVGPPLAVTPAGPDAEALPQLDLLYFRIPANTDLLGYWDTVADRLFKVRHCMNIEGVVRQLPLFEPPIDPAALVKAAAAGVDLSSVLSPSSVELSQYRFRTLAAKAVELCVDVRALGDRMLMLLERYDAEGLAMLRSAQEVSLQQAVRQVRAQAVDEAQQSWAALEKGIATVDKRITYYGSIPRMNAWEISGAISHGLGIVSQAVAAVLAAVSGVAPLVPEFEVGVSGFGGSPEVTVKYGGKNVGESSHNFAGMFDSLAGILHQAGMMLDAQGSFTRQDAANAFQKDIAQAERDQLTVQIEAARIRYLMAEKELENHDLAITQAQAVDEYLSARYTNQQLYDWAIKQLSTVYFQSYQLAYDMARRAESSFQFELATTDTFVQFGYWDSLKKGLLAADRLGNDVRRMEAAYLDRHRREFELTKHVSLAQFDPLALLALTTTGACTVTLPEWLFDLDHPGHIRRRLTSVAVTVSAVTGPYTSVNCTLSMTNNGVRLTDSTVGGYGDPLVAGDTRFARNPVLTASVATSQGVDDSGVLDLRFADERYRPFEGAGAVSEWSISLPRENNQFSLASVDDLVLRLDYTATAGSVELADLARANADAALPRRGIQLLVLDEEFATEWARLFHPDEGDEQALTFSVRVDQLPFWAQVRSATTTLRVTGVDLVIDTPYDGAFDTRVDLPGAAPSADAPAAREAAYGDLPHAHLDVTAQPRPPLVGEWTLQFKRDDSAPWTELVAADVRHAYLVVAFGVS